MADSYTQVTRNGYFGRVKNSIGGFFLGFLVVFGAIALLWFNEHRSIARYIGLDQAAESVVSVKVDMLSGTHEGKLIHTSGMTQAGGELQDNVYNVSTDALKLRRTVEMYQWKETESESKEDNLGGSETVTTTYSYDTLWSEAEISSNSFKVPEGHQNPSFEQPRSHTQVQANISIEQLGLNDSFVSQLNNYQALMIDVESLGISSSTGVLQISPLEIYYGADSARPIVGDKRVRFETVFPSMVSVMGEYNAGQLATHITENESTIALLESGEVSAQEMIIAAEKRNKLLTWGLRALGMLLLYIGFSMILGPLVIIAKIIPFVSRIIGFGTGLIAFLFTMVVGPIVIAIAWFAARPLISGGVIVVAGLIVGLVIYMRKQKTASTPEGIK